MKIAKFSIRNRGTSKQVKSEDLRYLQKAISGRSVYRNQVTSYLRKPKHRNVGFQY